MRIPRLTMLRCAAAGLLLALLAACQPAAQLSWRAADLRVLSAPNQTDPARDLFAAYARSAGSQTQIRLDVLNSPDLGGFDLYLALDTAAGEQAALPFSTQNAADWDLLLYLPAGGQPRWQPANALPPPAVETDPIAGSLSFILPVPRIRQAQAWLTLPGQSQPVDQIGPFAISGPAPGGQAPVLLAFWNTLPAATPAQALRRWSGAHTGPYGQRHGLQPLLQAAQNEKVPLVLLDLKTPQSLNGLQMVDGLAQVQAMQAQGLLTLPDVARVPPPAAQLERDDNRQFAAAMGISASPIEFGTFSAPHAPRFGQSPDPQHILAAGAQRLLPLPLDAYGAPPSAPASETLTRQGPALAVRLALINTALSADPTDLLALGGDLPTSAWGDLFYAPNGLHYLAAHPWIHLLSPSELLTFPARKAAGLPCGSSFCAPATSAVTHFYAEQIMAMRIQALQTSALQAAWIPNSSASAAFQALQTAYQGQTGSLLAADRWAAAPAAQQNCANDLDGDSLPECVLASEHFFAVLEPDGARLAFLFARSSRGVVQWVGPRSQFALGLGDPAGWQTSARQAADPMEIPGALTNPTDPWQMYAAQGSPGTVTFTAANGDQRQFTLLPDGLRVQGRTTAPTATRLLVAADAGRMWTNGKQSAHPAALTWQADDGSRLEIVLQQAELIAEQDFRTALPELVQPELPDRTYPPGHYVPFPLSQMDLALSPTYQIDWIFTTSP